MYRYFLIAKKFFSLGANNKKLLFHLGFSSLLRSATLLTLPFAASMIIGEATKGDFVMAIVWVVVFLVCSLVYVMCHHYNYEAYKNNSIFVHNKLQQKIMKKVSRLDENFTKDISVPFIINSGFNDISKVTTISDEIFDSVAYLISMFASVIILINVDFYIGMATLFLCVMSIWGFSHNVRIRDEYLALQRRHQDKITGLLGQVIDGGKEIKSFNMKDDLNTYLEEYKKDWRGDYLKKRRYHDRVRVVVPMILGIGKFVVYLIVVGLILEGKYDIATLVLVIGYYEEIQTRFEMLYFELAEVSSNATRVDRIHKILNYQTEHMLGFGKNEKDDIKGEIEFSDVSFAYEDQEMLRRISFKIKPRSFTVIVGKSGNGKSTIFRLLLRLYKINKGKILLDGVSIYDYSKDIYTSNVSIVTQKPFIFDMSIRENLNLVDSNHEHQIRACKRVGIHDYIMGLEDGYNTKLVADAENISSGEKQLLAFARTLLSGAEVLLFDEVTSNLDMNTSKRIFRVMQDIKRDRTVLVITHNPELMKIADDIMVIDKGKVVGRGTHATLLKRNKYYQVLQK